MNLYFKCILFAIFLSSFICIGQEELRPQPFTDKELDLINALLEDADSTPLNEACQFYYNLREREKGIEKRYSQIKRAMQAEDQALSNLENISVMDTIQLLSEHREMVTSFLSSQEYQKIITMSLHGIGAKEKVEKYFQLLSSKVEQINDTLNLSLPIKEMVINSDNQGITFILEAGRFQYWVSVAPTGKMEVKELILFDDGFSGKKMMAHQKTILVDPNGSLHLLFAHYEILNSAENSAHVRYARELPIVEDELKIIKSQIQACEDNPQFMSHIYNAKRSGTGLNVNSFKINLLQKVKEN